MFLSLKKTQRGFDKMKNFVSFLTIVVFALTSMASLIACNDSSTSTSEAYQKITAKKAYQMMQDKDEYVLLDVRTEEEFKEKHIEGAVLVPDYDIKNSAVSELPDKGALILVYCRSGRRSANAASELAAMGYTNVYDFGGIIDWPYGTVSE